MQHYCSGAKNSLITVRNWMVWRSAKDRVKAAQSRAPQRWTPAVAWQPFSGQLWMQASCSPANFVPGTPLCTLQLSLLGSL